MAGTKDSDYQGWAWGLFNTKSHYYASDVGKWLCGVDMGPVLSTELLDDHDDHPDNCLKCLRSLAKRRPFRPMPDRIVYPMPTISPELEAFLWEHVKPKTGD